MAAIHRESEPRYLSPRLRRLIAKLILRPLIDFTKRRIQYTPLELCHELILSFIHIEQEPQVVHFDVSDNPLSLHRPPILQHQFQETDCICRRQLEDLFESNPRIPLARFVDIQQERPHVVVELDAQAILWFVADDIENRVNDKTSFAIPQLNSTFHQTVTDFFKPCEIGAIAKDCFELAGL